MPFTASNKPEFSALYIDTFNSIKSPPRDPWNQIYGNATKENNLLQDCLDYGFNFIYLYDFNNTSTSSSQDRTNLKNFIKKFQDQGIGVGVAAGSINSVTKAINYNLSAESGVYKLERCATEYEWWNIDPQFGTTDFFLDGLNQFFLPARTAVNNYNSNPAKTPGTPDMKLDLYAGFSGSVSVVDPGGTGASGAYVGTYSNGVLVGNTVTFTPTNGGSGAQGAISVNSTTKEITKLVLENSAGTLTPGTGYIDPPIVTINQGAGATIGTGATFRAWVDDDNVFGDHRLVTEMQILAGCRARAWENPGATGPDIIANPDAIKIFDFIMPSSYTPLPRWSQRDKVMQELSAYASVRGGTGESFQFAIIESCDPDAFFLGQFPYGSSWIDGDYRSSSTATPIGNDSPPTKSIQNIWEMLMLNGLQQKPTTSTWYNQFSTSTDLRKFAEPKGIVMFAYAWFKARGANATKANTEPSIYFGPDQTISDPGASPVRLSDYTTLPSSSWVSGDNLPMQITLSTATPYPDTYTWDLSGAPGVTISSGATTIDPYFLFPGTGAYTFGLNVYDGSLTPSLGGEGLTGYGEITITVVNTASNPTVDAGSSVNTSWIGPVTNINVAFGATADSVPPGNTLTYSWSGVSTNPLGGTVTFSSSTVLNPTWIRLSRPGEYTLTLTVTDTVSGLQASDTVTVTASQNLSAIALVNNSILNYTAGTNPTTTTSPSSASTGTYVTYQWSCPSPNVFISNPSLLNTAVTFYAPGTYTLTLTVSNGYAPDNTVSTVNIIVNQIPTVSAGPDLEGYALSTFFISGATASDNPPGGLTYLWEELSGPVGSPATITSDTDLNPEIYCPGNGVYVFRLTATDPQGVTASDQMTISTSPVERAIYVNLLGGSGGASAAIINPSTFSVNAANLNSLATYLQTKGYTTVYYYDLYQLFASQSPGTNSAASTSLNGVIQYLKQNGVVNHLAVSGAWNKRAYPYTPAPPFNNNPKPFVDQTSTYEIIRSYNNYWRINGATQASKDAIFSNTNSANGQSGIKLEYEWWSSSPLNYTYAYPVISRSAGPFPLTAIQISSISGDVKSPTYLTDLNRTKFQLLWYPSANEISNFGRGAGLYSGSTAKTNWYMGYFSPSSDTLNQSFNAVRLFDSVDLAVYVPNTAGRPLSNPLNFDNTDIIIKYALSRLATLADAARSAGKVLNVNFVFSAENNYQGFIGGNVGGLQYAPGYFREQGNTPDTLFAKIMSQYNNPNGNPDPDPDKAWLPLNPVTQKPYLNITGYTIFTYHIISSIPEQM